MKARILLSVFLTAALANAQTDNTLHVKEFPGATVAAKLTAAMAACNPNTTIPCILQIDPSLAAWPTGGALPTLCTQCSLADYRTGFPSGGASLPAGMTSDGLNGLIVGGRLAVQGITQTSYAPGAYFAFGDSITVGLHVVTPANVYVARIGTYLGLGSAAIFDRGNSGDQACDVPVRMLTTGGGDSPVVAAVPALRTLMIGTNDVSVKGTGAYEAVARLCFQASVTWATVPLSSKVVGSTATGAGTCTTDTTFPIVTGEKCTASGSTITFSGGSALTTAGGPIYIWYRIIDGDAGAFTVQVDGGTATPLTTATTPAIATQNGSTASVALLRLAGISAGTHSIVLTQTNTGTMSVLAVGTPNASLNFASLPYLVVGEVPNQLNGLNAATIAAYRADQAADVVLLRGDGLSIAVAPVSKYLQATTAANDMFDTVHPLDNGQGEIYAAFQAPIKLAAQVPPAYSSFKQVTTYTVLQADSFPGTILFTGNGTVTFPALADGTVVRLINVDASNPTTIAGGNNFAPTKVYPGGSLEMQYSLSQNWWSPISQGGFRTATSGSLGGSALTAGQCSSVNAVTGLFALVVGNHIGVTPNTYPGDGFWWEGYVSAAGTVTVKVCAAVAGTPTASTYVVRIFP